ncbi:helix-turn-helix transcriptional regulator [Dactylosporangium roseum]|uniref:Helix-turn-helix transcriptional regulator n=1 Tax=Dactylosporangium roseum TaxID=47989 RepID=A0ABY5Z7R9_9ACTN|nr:helix-turn-helix transcriptional regulator [Dactylosporangium roseum]UWZ37050.1 helix-turn-helix transcriptional regulator [Dactylosporangium roseum]
MEQIITGTAVANDFGVLVANRRRRLGMSQRDLADRVCAVSGRPTVTRHELSRYERGARLPSRPMIAVLADVLNVPIASLTDAIEATLARRRREDAVEPRRPG